MSITELREEIDRIDNQLLRLFAQRMEVSSRIANYKKEHNIPIFDPTREREKLQDVGNKAGPELANHARVLYSLLFELSRSYQSQFQAAKTELFQQIVCAIDNTPKLFPQQATIACCAQENPTITMACERLFKDPSPLFFNSVDAVFSALSQGMCRYGMIALEDASTSSVKSVYDQLIAHKCSIVRCLHVQGKNGVRIKFVCISKDLEIYPGADKTSIMMVVPHRPGALYRVLARLYVLGINVSRLESCPIAQRDYDYRFYFDLETSIYSDEFVRLMCELDDLCKEFAYLGSYCEVV